VEKLHLIYLGACEDYLARDGEECPGGSAKDVVKEIQFYEGQFSSQHCFALATDDATQQLQDERVKLRRLDIFARYSDYMKRISSNLTSRTSERTPDIGKASSDYQWSETSKKLKAEEPWWKEYGTTKGTEAVKTTYSIHKICRDCRIDLNKVIQAIHTYSGQTGHSLLDDLLRDANFHEIAITLQRDHKVLASIMPAGMGTEEEFIRTVVLELCDRWFQINVADGGSGMEKPWSWWGKEKLQHDHAERKTSAKEEEWQVSFSEEVAVGAAAKIAWLDMQ